MNNIKKFRDAINLSQEELAKKLNVTQGSVSQWETGVSFPKSELLPVLANVLNCTIDDIFKRDVETA